MKISITKSSHKKETAYTLASVLVLLIFWKIISLGVGKEIIIPSPENTLLKMIEIITEESFLLIVWNTFKRVILGFSLALAAGMMLGMAAGFLNPIYYLLRPLVIVYRAIPSMAIILLALIWLESETAPIFVGFLVIFPILYENIVHGIRNVDPKLVEMGKAFKLSKSKMIKDIYIPSMKSYLMSASFMAIGLNLKIIIAAEVLSQPRHSIGTSFYIERANLNTTGVFAWSLIAIILAGITENIIRVFQMKRKAL
jgi:NitT/TauT family transport system permease protein